MISTLVDYFSKWPEAAPLKDKSAHGVALFLYECFCRLVFIIDRRTSIHHFDLWLGWRGGAAWEVKNS